MVYLFWCSIKAFHDCVGPNGCDGCVNDDNSDNQNKGLKGIKRRLVKLRQDNDFEVNFNFYIRVVKINVNYINNAFWLHLILQSFT